MIYWFASFLIGGVAVLQAGLNRQISKSAGLLGATLLNTVLMFFVLVLIWLATRYAPQFFSESFVPKWNPSELKWWVIIPGLCGIVLVAGIPTLLPKLGASGVFLGIVVGQMICSLLWDVFVEQMPFEPKRLVGASLAIVGLLIVNWKN